MLDIYFEPDYGKLYEKHEKGTSQVFEFKSQHGTVNNMFIKREIPFSINNEKYYDIVTPYGYGGPIITNVEKGSTDVLVAEFIDEFQQYCEQNNIVSEFVRFHPLVENAYDFEKYYDTLHIRNTVGTNLENYKDPFQTEFSKSCRKNVRRALRSGVTFNIVEKPSDVSNFKDIYYSTMDRNNAMDYYYFDEGYFNSCVELFQDNLLLVEAVYEEKVIAMGFYFVYKNYIHIHLSGTLSDYLYLSPAYVLRYGVTQWGKENGYKMIHHGGGRTNSPDDGLLKFKKQFGKNTEFQFFIGKKIWNKEIYKQLCQMRNVDGNVEFFPAYRYEELK